MTEPINFEAARGRRTEREIDANQAEWEATREQLFTVMMSSRLYYGSTVSAALRAMLEMLHRCNLSTDDAKALIDQHLRMFR
jgi:hypothetical protein